jgi:ABC-type multidrug transport system fused ATPase/permease subunit
MKTYFRLLGYLHPYRFQVGAGLSCMLLATPLSLAHPWIWKYLVDEVILRRQPDRLLPAVALMAAAYLAGTVLEAARQNLLERVALAFVRDLRNQAYRKLQDQSLEYVQQHRSGDLTARIVGDVDVLQSVAIQITEALLANVYAFLVIGACISALSLSLAWIVLPPVLVVWVLARSFNERVKGMYRSARGRLGEVSASLQEALAGVLVSKAFAQEEREAARFEEQTERHYHAERSALNARSAFYPLVRYLGFFTSTASIAAGTWLILQGQFTLGGLIAFRAYASELLQPVFRLAQITDLLQRGAAAAGRVFELLDAPVAIRDAPDAVELPTLTGRVTFEDVRFAYGDRTILDGIDLDVSPGEVVGIVGSSGAGKSTLVHLAPRFWDAQSGRVLVDGWDVRSLALRSLRREIAVVPQEPFLFSGSVLDNVRYARPDAAVEDVRAAARAANALGFIEEELKDGWDTQVGERGVCLSGGQRQRLCIARAFLADARILILDEPTSAVEPESEWIIQQALERLAANRTTLIVSHRLSLVRWADRIVVLADGRIVEQGCHTGLIERGGIYAEMDRLQSMGSAAPCPS